MKRGPALLILATVLGSAGCPMHSRSPAIDPEQPFDGARLAKSLDLDLVSELGSRTISFEVHWVEGCRPHDEALDGLRETVREFAPEKTVAIEIDPAPIPRGEWGSSGIDEGAADVWVERHARHAEPAEGTPRIQVHYIPDARKWFNEDVLGKATGAAIEGGDGHFDRIPVIYVASDTVARASNFRGKRRELERAVLVHELGHTLGLTWNFSHTQEEGGAHCTEPRCVMNRPAPGRRLCEKCLDDLRSARSWAAAEHRAGRDPIAANRSEWPLDSTIYEVHALMRRGREAEARSRLNARIAANERFDRPGDVAADASGYGWYPEAERLLRISLESLPPGLLRADALDLIAVLAVQGRYDEVLESPYGSEWDRAAALRALGRSDEAVDVLRASQRRSDTARLDDDLAEALWDAGRLDEALDVVRRSETRRLSTIEGDLLLELNRKDEARAAFRRVLRDGGKVLRRGDARAGDRAAVARALARRGDLEGARAALVGPGRFRIEGKALLEYARILAFSGDEPAAMEALLQARREGGVGRLNPCLDRDLRVLKDDPRFAEHFPCEPKPSK